MKTMRFRPNVYCFLLRFWQETVLADRPLIEYAGDSERAREMVRVLTPSLLAAAELVVGDMIRYGVGLFVNRVPWTIQAGEPRWWYPVRTPYMSPPPPRISGPAYPYFETGAADAETIEQFPKRLSVTRLAGGMSRTRTYPLETLSVGEMTEEPMDGPAGMPAVIPVRNGPGFYGTSDYEDVGEYVDELSRRESSISQTLDRHADPHLAVAEESLDTTADGKAALDVKQGGGNVIAVPAGGTELKYIDWNPRFDAQAESIKRAEGRVLSFSRISLVLIDLAAT